MRINSTVAMMSRWPDGRLFKSSWTWQLVGGKNVPVPEALDDERTAQAGS